MMLLATLRMAWRSLKRNRMRTFLTMLGIIIGVSAVITMVSLGNGARKQVEQRIASMGQNILVIYSGSASTGGVRSGWGGARTLTVEDAEAILEECPAVKAVSPISTRRQQVVAGNQNWSSSVEGVSPDYLDIRSWPLANGEFFNDSHIKSAAKVCIIGQTTVTQLFNGQDPIGETIRISKVPFTVIGELTTKGQSVLGFDQDDIILVPYTTEMKRLSREQRLRQINVSAQDAASVLVAQEQIKQLLRQRHKIATPEDDDFFVRNQDEIATAATETQKIMSMLLAGIAGVSLLVGGIGIMNIMLVSVTERTREIGIRMSVGARGRDILGQFLIEAVVLSATGGAMGILLGMGASWTVTTWLNWPAQASVTSIVVAFVFSSLIGVFFGFYPARKAAALDPIEALRYE